MTDKDRYIAIADLALARGDEWSKEFKNSGNGEMYKSYFMERLNSEWNYDDRAVTEEDYDYVIENAHDLCQVDMMSCIRKVWDKVTQKVIKN